MPYTISRIPHTNLYKVYNKNTGRVYAKHTTKEKAEAQLRLLRMMGDY